MNHPEARPMDESLLRRTAIRIVKEPAGLYGMPEIRFDADFYCRKLEDPAFCYETEAEYVVYAEHTRLTDACLVRCEIPKDARWRARAILLEGRRLPFRETEDRIDFTFDIGGLAGRTRTLYTHTLINEPGLTLRVEQNDPGRVAGAYRGEPYPDAQIRAAQHYVFAAREVLRALHVPQYLAQTGLGYVLLLCFETCNELHSDYPPHWHLIFRWPNHCGSQAPHIYLDEAGRMTHALVSVDLIPHVRYDYRPGEWCRLVDMYGRELLRFRITEAGGMAFSRPDCPVYTLSPYGEDGVTVACEGETVCRIAVRNDEARGQLEIRGEAAMGAAWQEEITYDPLLGTVLTHTSTRN